VGLAVGVSVGESVGANVGLTVGANVGANVGFKVGEHVGLTVGASVGAEVGVSSYSHTVLINLLEYDVEVPDRSSHTPPPELSKIALLAEVLTVGFVAAQFVYVPVEG
jgi:phage tail tape-measure protein